MFKKAIVFATLLAISSTAVHAAKPTTFLGKIGASALQIIHANRGLLTFPVAVAFYNNTIARTPEEKFIAAALSLIPWCIANATLSTVTNSLMKNFDVDPLT